LNLFVVYTHSLVSVAHTCGYHYRCGTQREGLRAHDNDASATEVNDAETKTPAIDRPEANDREERN
jgi:hypothetical protein